MRVEPGTTPPGSLTRESALALIAEADRWQRTYNDARDEIAVLQGLVRRASAFVNGIAVLADNKGPALGWLADAEIAMPGEILGDPDGPIDESDHDHS
jgi:hypothetical protein